MPHTILKGRKAIICEDEGLRVTILSRVLRHMGADDVRAFRTCDDALQAVEAEKPHVVLLNVSPDSLEAALNLKKLRETCVIAILTHNDPTLIANAKAAGADGVLVKPYFSEDILYVLQRTRHFGPPSTTPN